MPQEKSDDDKNLPRATVDKLIHDLIPKGYSISKECREYLRISSQSFLCRIALESSKFCETENKKTITNTHVFKALSKHGFPEFIDPCTTCSTDYQIYSSHKPSKQNKFKDCGMTMEQLEEDQMKLFKDARREVDSVYEVKSSSDDEE